MNKISYALGLSIGQNLQGSGIKNINAEEFVKGMNDIFSNKKPELSENEINQILDDFFNKLKKDQVKVNQEEGEKFLKTNKNREGVVTLPSGLQYEIITKGNGPTPKASDTVKTHYHGTLIDGSIFDSSVQRGEAATFGVSQVISGWVEALQLMPKGSKWRLFIPSELAYGERGAGSIGPNSTLIFEVELLDIL